MEMCLTILTMNTLVKNVSKKLFLFSIAMKRNAKITQKNQNELGNSSQKVFGQNSFPEYYMYRKRQEVRISLKGWRKIMLDLNKIVNDEIQKAYLKGRKEAASELGNILSKKNNNNAYEIDMQMIDKISEELNREWSLD